MSNEFSQKITELLSLGKEEATRLRSRTINPEHLLLGIIRRGKGCALDMLRSMNVDLLELKETIERRSAADQASDQPYNENVEMSLSTARVLRFCTLEARAFKATADIKKTNSNIFFIRTLPLLLQLILQCRNYLNRLSILG